MAVRPATIADAPALAALNTDVQQLHHGAAPQWFKPPDATAAMGYFDDLLRSGAFRAFVAELDGRPRGYALARVRDLPESALTYGARVVELDQIAVDPAYRGRGLGRALIDAVRAYAEECGADRVQLAVWDFNTPARSMFEAAGFTPTISRLAVSASRRR